MTGALKACEECRAKKRKCNLEATTQAFCEMFKLAEEIVERIGERSAKRKRVDN
jgi:hypothetical protein